MQYFIFSAVLICSVNFVFANDLDPNCLEKTLNVLTKPIGLTDEGFAALQNAVREEILKNEGPEVIILRGSRTRFEKGQTLVHDKSDLDMTYKFDEKTSGDFVKRYEAADKLNKKFQKIYQKSSGSKMKIGEEILSPMTFKNVKDEFVLMFKTGNFQDNYLISKILFDQLKTKNKKLFGERVDIQTIIKNDFSKEAKNWENNLLDEVIDQSGYLKNKTELAHKKYKNLLIKNFEAHINYEALIYVKTEEDLKFLNAIGYSNVEWVRPPGATSP